MVNAIGDKIADSNPVIKSLVSDTKKVSEELFSKVKDFKSPDNEIVKFGKETFSNTLKNSLDDLKSGNLYNRQRMEAAENEMNIIYEGIGIEPLNELKGSQTKADELKRMYNGVLVLEDEFFKLIEYFFTNFDKIYKIISTKKPSLKDITKVRNIGEKANDDVDEICRKQDEKMRALGFNKKTFWKDIDKITKKFINVYGDASVNVKKEIEPKLKERMDKCKPLWDRYAKYGTDKDFGNILDKYEELGGNRESIARLIAGWHNVIGNEISATYDDLSHALKLLKLDKYNSAFGKFLQKIKL